MALHFSSLAPIACAVAGREQLWRWQRQRGRGLGREGQQGAQDGCRAAQAGAAHAGRSGRCTCSNNWCVRARRFWSAWSTVGSVGLLLQGAAAEWAEMTVAQREQSLQALLFRCVGCISQFWSHVHVPQHSQVPPGWLAGVPYSTSAGACSDLQPHQPQMSLFVS